ncbi:hypothetical protein BH23THE1_BH23THE1_25870 [soil metagenome]
MNDRLIFVISFTSIFIILTIMSGGTLCANAQSDSFKNNSSSGSKTAYAENSSSIITPLNTGNERNNSGTSSIG